MIIDSDLGLDFIPLFLRGVGWVLGAKWPFETVVQSISRRLPEREKKREMIDERRNVQTTPPAPTASASGPCPTINQQDAPTASQGKVLITIDQYHPLFLFSVFSS